MNQEKVLTPQQVKDLYFPHLRSERQILAYIREGRLKAECRQIDKNNPRTKRYTIKPEWVQEFLQSITT